MTHSQQQLVLTSVEDASVEWEPAPWLPGSVKHGSRAAWVLASKAHDVDEVIFVDRDGRIGSGRSAAQ